MACVLFAVPIELCEIRTPLITTVAADGAVDQPTQPFRVPLVQPFTSPVQHCASEPVAPSQLPPAAHHWYTEHFLSAQHAVAHASRLVAPSCESPWHSRSAAEMLNRAEQSTPPALWASAEPESGRVRR